MMKYILITATEFLELEAEVQQALALGWKPQGSLVAVKRSPEPDDILWVQPMTKVPKPDYPEELPEPVTLTINREPGATVSQNDPWWRFW